MKNIIKTGAFTYNVVGFDHVKKEYTLKHIKTGEIKVISKDDFDYHLKANKKKH